jgi:hypothetical protein
MAADCFKDLAEESVTLGIVEKLRKGLLILSGPLLALHVNRGQIEAGRIGLQILRKHTGMTADGTFTGTGGSRTEIHYVHMREEMLDLRDRHQNVDEFSLVGTIDQILEGRTVHSDMTTGWKVGHVASIVMGPMRQDSGVSSPIFLPPIPHRPAQLPHRPARQTNRPVPQAPLRRSPAQPGPQRRRIRSLQSLPE